MARTDRKEDEKKSTGRLEGCQRVVQVVRKARSRPSRNQTKSGKRKRVEAPRWKGKRATPFWGRGGVSGSEVKDDPCRPTLLTVLASSRRLLGLWSRKAQRVEAGAAAQAQRDGVEMEKHSESQTG